MLKAIINEIRNSITKSFFHLVRFGGLLLIPFIYGFSYIYAFYDPFEKVSEVKVSLITDNNDPLGEALGKQLSKENIIHMGDVNMTMKMDHIYNKDVNYDDVKKNSYATVKLENLSKLDPIVIDFVNAQKAGTTGTPSSAQMLEKLKAQAKFLLDLTTMLVGKDPLVKFTLNYKKSYLLAFGIDTGASMYSSIQYIEKQMMQALQDPNYASYITSKMTGVSSSEFISYIKAIEAQGLSQINPLAVEAHMGEHAKYGYGLAPFFISVAMWIGAMVMTFAIHRKIYDKTISAGRRYFAKWILMFVGVILQASILMTGLYFIGFKELGIDHWGYLYIGAIVSGSIFISIIQAIRFSIHNRTIGILLTIMLLVLQMASGGGLFPIETQSSFYQAINKVVPMAKTVNILRELSFNTNWQNVMYNLGYLLIWLFIVPIGVYINNKRTVNIYKEQKWDLPPGMAYRENIKKNKAASKKGGA